MKIKNFDDHMSMIIKDFETAYFSDEIEKEYLHYSRFFQHIFISKGTYIIDTGNYQTANEALLYLVMKKINKHPLIWRIFFMI